MNFESIYPGKLKLGEGPMIYDGHFYCVDILGSKIVKIHLQNLKYEHIELFEMPTCIQIWNAKSSVSQLPEFVVADKNKLYLSDLKNYKNLICEVEIEFAMNRFNDGQLDKNSRLWIGTMDMSEDKKPNGNLYMLDRDLKLHKKASGIFISNGMAWSKDNKTMFHTDSIPSCIYSYDYDADRAEIKNKKIFYQHTGEGCPDGMFIDDQDCIFTAIWDEAKVIKLDTNAKPIKEYLVPMKKTTSCFIHNTSIYISSASDEKDMTKESIVRIKL